MKRTPKTAGWTVYRIADVVEQYRGAVVNIEVVQETSGYAAVRLPGWPWRLPEDDREPELRQLNIGSGFFFDKRGLILTNEHVIHGATDIEVRLLGRRDPVEARIVGAHYELDLAVLSVRKPKGLPILELARSKDIRVGEWVVAIGNPLGLDHTVTVGVISAKERPMSIGDRRYPHLIQTDAAINRGNSGGPLINLRGRVVGINTAVSQSSQGIGFAIAVDVIRKALKEMMS
ncbi:MAG: trypsin-like peptidase domain-containing protein [Alicyclobacillaceae bacterium]|nr:trypsin-like peptidase domain-containing protein [Alicyclobacillaceae bacterium]